MLGFERKKPSCESWQLTEEEVGEEEEGLHAACRLSHGERVRVGGIASESKQTKSRKADPGFGRDPEEKDQQEREGRVMTFLREARKVADGGSACGYAKRRTSGNDKHTLSARE